MFDLSNPQKRERLLVIFAGIAVCTLIIGIVPNEFRKINNLRTERDKLTADIETHERHARNKDAIQSRLSTMESQALASSTPSLESESVSRYQTWLTTLATSAGLGNPSSNPQSSPSARGGAYKKHSFTLSGEGRLDQIAEFLRRFHRTEFLHQIQRFSPRTIQNRPGIFNVTFYIDALSMPQVNSVNVPSSGLEATAITDAEGEKLKTIRERAILSEYTPTPPASDSTPAPPPEFDDVAYCFVIAVVESDGKPQCWIDHRTMGKTYRLREGESFPLLGIQCVIKKIDIDAQQIQVEVSEMLGTLKVGKHFDEIEWE